MTKIPEWAEELCIQVCKDEKRSLRKLPKVKWVHRTGWRYRTGSGGNYSPYENRIRINTREGHDDQKQVLLHELCHWLTQPRGLASGKKRNWHGKRFYIKLNQLLLRYDCWTAKYQEREGRYMKNSVLYLKV